MYNVRVVAFKVTPAAGKCLAGGRTRQHKIIKNQGGEEGLDKKKKNEV